MTGRLKARCVAGVRDERGATAVFFAVGLLLLAPATMGLIDLYMITTQRGQLQDALDTATLYVARSTATTATEIQTKGDAALRANLKLPDDQEITSTKFELAADKITIKGEATIEPPSIGPQLWAQADIRATSEVLRNSNNVEVALVLDTTGSMEKQMDNLRTAAKDLVDLVVKDQQPPAAPYYTKVAIVPYAVGVNAGAFAEQARGTLIGPTTIDSIYGSNSKVMVKAVNHGLTTGERVQLQGVSNPKLGSKSMNTDYTITRQSADVFSIDGASASNLSGTYGSGGKVYCLREGCEKYRFKSASSNWRIFSAGKCASERTGMDAYTDAAPSISPVGRLYDGGSGNPCASAEIMPLSSDKTALKARIGSLTHAGSTAGQIGLAWGWYMVSPEWKALWTDKSEPAAYSKPQLLKVVILMTDGAFNSPYCKGVIAKNATSGSGSDDDHNECDATNGDPFTQAATMCTNMKAKGIIIYTVGFNVGSETAVKNLMNNCATSPEYVYMPNGGAELKVAFRAIAQDINSLRIAK